MIVVRRAMILYDSRQILNDNLSPVVMLSYKIIKFVLFLSSDIIVIISLARNSCSLMENNYDFARFGIHDQRDHLRIIRDNIHKLENKTLYVCIVIREPFVNYNEQLQSFINTTRTNNNSSQQPNQDSMINLDDYSGIAIEVVKRLSVIFRFKVQVTRTIDNQFGVQGSNGKWTGLLGSLVRNESDLGVTALSITARRAEYVDFTRPYYVETASILLRMPDEIQNFFVVFEPFSSIVWFVLLGSILGLILIVIVMTKLEDSQRKQHKLHKLYKRLKRLQEIKRLESRGSRRTSASTSKSRNGSGSGSGSRSTNDSSTTVSDKHRRNHRESRKSVGFEQLDFNELRQIEASIELINHFDKNYEFGKTWTDRFYYSVSCVLNILLNKGKCWNFFRILLI